MPDFISSYLRYAAIDEAPEMWHLWAGYGALSTAIGRRVWLPHGAKLIYPNLYILFVGNAAAGKNSAISPCRELLKTVGDVSISFSVETVEGVCRIIGGQPNADPPKISECLRVRLNAEGKPEDTHEMCFLSNEFTDLIRVAPEAWPVFLNDIFDCGDYKYRTKNLGSDVITNPYITLIAGLTTGQAHKLQQIDIINSGFARRTLTQYGERAFHKPIPRPHFGPIQQSAKAACVAHIEKVRKLTGAFRLTPETEAWWDEWYVDNNMTIKQRSTPQTEGYLGSKSMQVQKLAMLSALSREDCDLTIHIEDFQRGLHYLNVMEEGFPYIYGAMGRNELAGLAIQLLEYIQKQPEPVTRSKLSVQFFPQLRAGFSQKELMEVLEHLCDKGDLVAASLFDPKLKRQDFCWATPAIMQAFAAKYGAQPSGAAPSA